VEGCLAHFTQERIDAQAHVRCCGIGRKPAGLFRHMRAPLLLTPLNHRCDRPITLTLNLDARTDFKLDKEQQRCGQHTPHLGLDGNNKTGLRTVNLQIFPAGFNELTNSTA